MKQKRNPIRGKEKKHYLKIALNLIKNPENIFTKKSNILLEKQKRNDLLILDEKPIFIILKHHLIPTLQTIKEHGSLIPEIAVDKGAIKFIVNGSDVMRPGVTQIDDGVEEQGLVLIVEDVKRNPLGIGLALYDKVDIEDMKKGRVIKNIHHLNDEWWNY